MTKARYENVPPQFIAAGLRRQRYLDFINANPGAIVEDLMVHMRESFGEDVDPSNTLSVLLEMRHVRRVRVANGKLAYAYYASAKKAQTAEEAWEAREKKRAKRLREIANPNADRVPDGPYHYIHKPGSIDLGRQGGQGALRQRTGVGSCAEWI